MTTIAHPGVINRYKPAALWNSARTWAIILPLIYYTNGGSIGSGEVSADDFGRFHFISLVLATGLTLLLTFKRPAEVLASSLRMKLIIAMPVLAFITCLWSADPKQSLLSSVPLFCFTLFAIYLAESFSPDELLDLVMLTGVIVVCASLLVGIFLPGIGASEAGWRGIFPHKQQCAGGTTVFLVTAMHWKPKTGLQRTLRVIFAFLCIGLIIMTQSKIGWLLTLTGLVCTAGLLLIERLPSRDSLFLTLMGIPVVGGLAFLASQFSDLILYKIGKDPTLSERTTIWAAAWIAILQNPWFGYGYKTFWWGGLNGPAHGVVLATGWSISQAQSGYIDLWLSFGIGGMIILALMTTQGGLNALRSFRSAIHPNFVRWCIVIIICNLEYNIGESDFAYVQIVWFLFLLACIGLRKEAQATASLAAL